MTPKMFQYNLVKRLKKHRKHIVLPENDDRIITSRLLSMDGDITILGRKQIENKVAELGISFDFQSENY
jgi:phosphate acetyltransferase